MKIAIGSDHRGYKLKEEIKKYLEENDIEYIDYGTNSEELVNFPYIAKDVCLGVKRKEYDKAILICGSGFGMTIVANKFKGIRCVSCFNEETAKLAKQHNNINVLALPADFVNTNDAICIIRTWIATEFLGGRYEDRNKMIEEIEKENMK